MLLYIIIIISSSQSTAGRRFLQSLAILLDLRLLASSSRQLSCANRHSTWPEGVLQYGLGLSTPTVVGSTADMASPMPLQHANTVYYVGDFSSLSDYLVSDSIPQRNPEYSSFSSSLSDLELVDQPCRECLRLGSVCRRTH
jgi:hypothetical protein